MKLTTKSEYALLALIYLARNDENQLAAIYGAGVQAKMQLWAVAEARKLRKAYVYDLNPEVAGAFAKEMSEKLGLEVVVVKDKELLYDADIICLATSASQPIIEGNKIKEGTHINGIGSHTPDARELDTITVKRSKFIGDSREACFKEAGDIIIPMAEGAIEADHFYAELGEIITARKAGRVNSEEITLFKSNGLAIQDAATAKLIYDKAVEKGIGQKVVI